MNYIRRFIYMSLLTLLVLGVAAGCSSKRQEQQETLRAQGIAYMEKAEYEKALDAFQKALDESLGEIKTMELDICFYKAQTQYMLGDIDGAMATYTAIIEYNQSSKAYYLRGNLHYAKEEEQLALQDYKEAIRYDGKNEYELYIGIYEALKAHDNPEQTTYLELAKEIKGDTAYDKMQKGRVNFLLGIYGEAVMLLQEAAAAGEPEANYHLTELYLATDKNEEALNTLNAYISGGSADAYRLYRIAAAQMEKENYAVSVSCLEAALKLENVPNRQSVMRTLAIAYERENDFASARTVLETYVTLYPDDEEAQRELTFLETR